MAAGGLACREIGYSLHRSAWGQGYELEAATATISWSLEVLGWSEFVHIISPDNMASIRLAQKLGSRLLRPTQMPPPYEEHRVDAWGQTAAEWWDKHGKPQP